MRDDKLSRIINALYNPLDRRELAELLNSLQQKADRKGVMLCDYIEAMVAISDQGEIDRQVDYKKDLLEVEKKHHPF